jgi:hypothetical protein
VGRATQRYDNQKIPERFWQRWQPIDWFTGCLVIVGIAYTCFAAAQWCTMNKTLEVEQRAYLNIGVMTLDPNDGVIILPVENSGKLPATDATIFGCAIRMHWPDKKELDVALNHYSNAGCAGTSGQGLSVV